MLIAILIVGAFVAHVALTWLFYCAVMALMAARDAGRIAGRFTWFCAYSILYTGMVLDLTLNIVWGTVVFLDPPAEWLLTIRLVRYKQEVGWRGRFAGWICTNLLDPIAPDGCHCK